jgi:hypothetical protein
MRTSLAVIASLLGAANALKVGNSVELEQVNQVYPALTPKGYCKDGALP